MPLGEAASLWRAYLAAFTQLLSRMAGDPKSAAGQRLARLFTEALQLWGTLMCSRPARTTAVMRHLLVRERRQFIHPWVPPGTVSLRPAVLVDKPASRWLQQ